MNVENIENLVDFPPFLIPAEHFAVAYPIALVVVLPALGTAARFYRPFAEALAARDYCVLLPELPGTGASKPKPSWQTDYGYPALVEQYLPGLVEAARRLAQGRPVVVAGHSLGAQVGMLAVVRGTADMDAMVTIAGGHIHYRNWDGAGTGKLLFAAGLASSLTWVFGHLPGQYFGFGGPQARTLMREWSRTIRSGRFPGISGTRRHPASIPSLCIGYEGDFFAPEKSVGELAGMLSGEQKIMPVEWSGNPHSSWARNPGTTVELMDKWLTKKCVIGQ